MGIFQVIAFILLSLMILMLFSIVLLMAVVALGVLITDLCDEMGWDVPWERFKGDKKLGRW